MRTVTWDEFAAWVVGAPLRILLIIVLAYVLRWVVHRAIRTMEHTAIERVNRRGGTLEHLVTAVTGAEAERRRQRTRTLASLLRSISTFAIGSVALLTVMAEIGLPLGPLLASAGVGGLAVGFGAQSLVKDFLSGIFMIVEDQYGVGDVIDTGQAVGTVEEVTLRITRLRDAEGVVWFIRNGEIVRIGNRSQGWAVATIDIPVAYDEDPARVVEILTQVAGEVHADPAWTPKLLEPPSVAGVQSVAGGTMTIRMFAKSPPGEQWGVQREVLARAKRALDAAGIRGPRLSPYDRGRDI
jgi:small-conductance mechanosensitive channel